MSNGFAEIGLYGLPWLFLGIYALLVGLVFIAVRTWERDVAAKSVSAAPNGAPDRRSSTSHPVSGRLAWVALWLPLIGLALTKDWDPLWAGEAIAPGPEVAEVRSDGTWQSDSIEHASSISWSAGDPCLMECPGPRWIFRVGPGETYSWVMTIWNHSSIPITLLGRSMPVGLPPHEGMALLRDPKVLSADPANLIPFRPVTIAAGELLPLAWLGSAPPCANPTAIVDALFPGAGWATGYPFVYEVLGWRREGIVWAHFSATVAGCDDPDPVVPTT